MGNRSSEFHPELRRVRREGSYIYEEFMPTGGTDVKVRYSLQCTRLYSTHIRKRICLSGFHVKLILLCCQPLQHTCKAPVCEGFSSCVQLVWLNLWFVVCRCTLLALNMPMLRPESLLLWMVLSCEVLMERRYPKSANHACHQY